MTASEQKVKGEDDQASEQAAESAGLGLVLSCAGQTQCTDNTQDMTETNLISVSGTAQEATELSASTQALAAGIADILEGLLREGQSADGTMQQADKLLVSAYEQAIAQQAASPDKDERSTDAVEGEAGMLEETSSNTMQAQLRGLIHEYLCSLENTNNTDNTDHSKMTTETTGTQDDAMAVLQNALHRLNSNTSTYSESGSGSGSDSNGNQEQQIVLPRAAESKNAEHTVPLIAAEKSPAFVMEAEQSVTTAAPVKEADMADNITRIVESISAQSSADAQEFTVSLKPEHLGKLSIKLVMDSDGLRAQIKAADSSVSGLIRSELNTLSDLLKDKGIQVTQIDVSYDTAAFMTDARHGNSNGQYQESPSKNRRTYTFNGAEPYGAVPTLTDAQQLLIQGSSIEFQA